MSEKIKEHKINKINNFIAGWYLSNKKLCKNLINLFEKSEYKKEGLVSNKINKLAKDSTDLSFNVFSQEPLIQEYIKNLSLVLEQYKKKI